MKQQPEKSPAMSRDDFVVETQTVQLHNIRLGRFFVPSECSGETVYVRGAENISIAVAGFFPGHILRLPETFGVYPAHVHGKTND